VWKLASCDGCQLTLLDCEDELLELAGAAGAVQLELLTALLAGRKPAIASGRGLRRARGA
jgi:coenzyme F420-reducing hydrogenase gamma subunit